MLANESQSKLTINEAAKLIQKSPSCIRQWLRSDFISGTQNEQGWWQIDRTSLLSYASQNAPRSILGAVGGSPHHEPQTSHSTSPIEVSLHARIADLNATIDHERRLNSELRTQVRELEKQQTQHLAEMRGMLEKQSPTSLSLSKWLRSGLKKDT